MKRPQSLLLRGERGQSLVELALTLPMLLVVMFMVTEFGRALFQYNLLAQATREGARVAVVDSEANAPTAGQDRMSEFLTNAGIDPDDLSELTCTVQDDPAAGSKTVVARAVMPFRWILQGDMPTNPQGGTGASPRGLDLAAETVMKAETF